MTAQKTDDFCYWTFIEKYYPKYYSCSDILLSDILTRKLNGEPVCDEDEEMIKDWNVKAELLELDQIIFSKALKNYFNIMACLKLKPDLTFKKLKIAIFVDSEFFHGKDWESQKDRVKTNAEYWQQKIERNKQPDSEVNEYLTKNGWKVLRFWSEKVEKDLDKCVAIIVTAMANTKSSSV